MYLCTILVSTWICRVHTLYIHTGYNRISVPYIHTCLGTRLVSYKLGVCVCACVCVCGTTDIYGIPRSDNIYKPPFIAFRNSYVSTQYLSKKKHPLQISRPLLFQNTSSKYELIHH